MGSGGTEKGDGVKDIRRTCTHGLINMGACNMEVSAWGLGGHVKSQKVMVLISLSPHYRDSFFLAQPSGQGNALFSTFISAQECAHTHYLLTVFLPCMRNLVQ